MSVSSTQVVVAPVRPRPSLRTKAIKGSVWTLLGYVGSQGLRLAGNVVLARLLFPEAFGLMVLVTLFMQGLQMFSDIGIAPSIIQNRRGDDPAFLNTAWTIQVMRGAGLWLAACAGAWPFAWFMGEDQLLAIIPVAGLSAVITGFQSTSMASLNRTLSLKLVTLWELGGQIISVVVMIAVALAAPSVWALVAGGLSAAVFRTASSHLLIRGYRNRFGWDREAARSLFRFGRWIFASTLLTFFAMQLDKLIMGKLLDIEHLGIYGIAVGFSLFSTRLVKGVGGRVGFPALSEVARERPHRLRHNLRTMRLALLGASAAVLVPFAVGGHWLVELLYDSRYHDAGWMLQLLAAGGLATAISSSAGHALLALGHSAQITLLLTTQLVILTIATLLGNHFGGQLGMVIGIASAETINYPVLAVILARHRLWQPEIDLPVFVLGGLALAAGLALNGSFGPAALAGGG